MNINPEYRTRYRAVNTGRIVKRTSHGFRDGRTGRFVRAVQEKAAIYRNLGGYGQRVGTSVSASKINALIASEKENKTWAKGEL